MTVLVFTVRGNPAPQGSKKAYPIYKGTGESKTFLRANIVDDEPETLHTWREAVKDAAMRAMGGRALGFPITGPVSLALTFTFRRPKSHFLTGRNAGRLGSQATLYPDYTGKVASAGPQDIDKALRAVMDALKDAGVYKDDAQVVHFDTLEKVWIGHPHAQQFPGAEIVVRTMDGRMVPVQNSLEEK